MKKIIYETPMKKTNRFKVGDLVRVSDKTHDDSMPKSRLGHIIGGYKAPVHYTNKTSVKTGAWELLMTNGVTLVFHEMFLEKVDENKIY